MGLKILQIHGKLLENYKLKICSDILVYNQGYR